MNAGFEQAQQLAGMWMEMATKMATAGMAFRQDQTPPEVAREVRDATFTAMGQAADKYMRSPQFLSMIKASLDASIGWRKQFNQMLTEAHHNVQGVAKQDVDTLTLAVKHLETRVLARVEEIGAQLEEINRRLAAVEAEKASPDNGHPRQTIPSPQPAE